MDCELVTIVQVIGMISSTMGILSLIGKKHNSATANLLVANIATLAYNIGYYLAVSATSEAVADTAIKVEYLGSGLMYIFCLKFILDYCEVNIPRAIFPTLFISEVFFETLIWLGNPGNLYYTSVEYVVENGYVVYNLGHGVLYFLRAAIIITSGIISVVICYRKMREPSSKRKCKNYYTIFLVTLITMCSYALMIVGITGSFNIVPAVSAITLSILSVRIFRQKMLTVIDMARENTIDNMDQAFIIVEKDMEYVYSNISARKLFPELEKIIAGDCISEEIAQMFDKNNFDSEMEIGEKYYVRNLTRLVEEKKEIGYCLTLTDITARQQLLKAFQEAKQKADAANFAKSEFLANMSHEIRTPINVILGMDEIILRENNDPKFIEYATNIQNAGKTLLSLINDILDFSKIESGKMEIAPVEYEVSYVLNDLVNMITLKSNSKGLKFYLDIDENIPKKLYGDDVRLKQVIINLLTNAVKYTPSGSVTFHIKAIKTNSPNLIDSAKLDRDDKNDKYVNLYVSIEDTGIGIREEDIPRLFESFQRLDENKTRSIEGTGLGIGIATSYLNMMGGTLEVESEYNKGSKFYFTIPQIVIDDEPMGDFHKIYEEAYVSRKSFKESFIAPKASILVVDDNALNIKVVEGLLKPLKLKLTTASSGSECLNLIQANCYDIIFLDHMMPEMDGIETLNKMKNMKENKSKDSAVIVLTANAINGAKEKYLQDGFCDYISKPINYKKMEEMIYKYLPQELIESANNDISNENNTGDNIEVLYSYGIDSRKALNMIGNSIELYFSIIKVYVKEASEKREKMKQYISDNNCKDYAILVHALKGDSRSIGANKLGEMAYEHELKSKAGDIEFVKGNFNTLCSAWDNVIKRIKLIY